MNKLVLESFLPYRLNRIASVVSRDFKAVYGRHYDLTVPEWRVLATLGEFQELGATAIGSHSCMHKTKVSRAVRALEGRRWLKRREVPQDRREELLSLTRLGQEAYAEIIPRAIAFEQSLLERLGEDAHGLLAALGRLEADVGAK
jgi:DNA-binding MarR family transcriptional regulator